tara:strand:- start:1157 stop:1549 length:393 start_codon:yes stop_codon:yes gene_type:complete
VEIFDKKNNLIAIIHKDINFNEGKTFYTDNEKEFQFGTFKLAKGEIIEKHIHNSQKREILKTSEAIVVLKGSLNIDLYDDDKNFIDAVTINTNDAILIFEGGHGIEVGEETKFLEFKQGPYIEDIDKKHF